MALTAEDTAVAASIVKFLNEKISTGNLGDDANEGLLVAAECINNAFKVLGSERTVSLTDAYRVAIQAVPPPKEATEEEKKKAEELKNEGNNFLKLGKLDEAVEAYSKAIELDPNNAIYYSNRAAVYLKMNNNDAALEDSDKALQLDPNYSKAYCRKGVAHMNRSENHRARDCFQKAVELEPGNETYTNNLTVVKDKIEAEMRVPFMPGMFPGLGGGMVPGMDPSALFSNPNFIEMATRVMQDPGMQSIMSSVVGNLMGAGPEGAAGPQIGDGVPPTAAPSDAAGPNLADFSNILRLGQQMAEQMASANPQLIDELRRQSEEQGDRQVAGSDAQAPSEKKAE